MNKMVLKPWQKEAYETLRDEQYRTINALTGSGKSYLMMHLAVSEALEEGRKSIICVPQEIISASFIDTTPHSYDDREVSSDEVQSLVCNTFNFNQKSDVCEQFLKSDKFILICSYQTFIAFYESHPKSFKDVTVYIDEAHHLRAQETEGNKLGGIIYDMVKKGKTNITLSSATLFRGDKIAILDKSIKDKFVRYNLDVDAYLKGMKYLKNIEIDVQTYAIESPFEAVKANYSGRKTIIYVPYVSTEEFKIVNSKGKWVRGIIGAIKHSNARLHGPDANGIYEVKNGGTKRILDLVTHDLEHRKAAKKYLVLNQKNEKAIDVILALGMMKEGANFVHASDAMIFGARNSIVEVVQILGRILRDAPNKKTAKMTVFVPRNIETSGPTFRQDVENYVKATLMNMIIEDVLYDGFNTKAPREQKEAKSSDPVQTVWGELGSEEKIALLSDVSDALMSIDDTAGGDECMAVIKQTVDESDATDGMDDEDKQEIAKRIYNIQMKQHMREMGKHVGDVDYKVIRDEVTNPMGWVLWTTREFGIKRFSDLRAACGQLKTFAEWKEYNDKLGFTFENQWTKHYNAHPEFLGVYPAMPSRAYGYEWPTKGYLSGTKSDWLKLVKKLGFTCEGQWVEYYSAHPELKGVYPYQPSRAYGYEWPIKGNELPDNKKEWLALIKKLGFTYENQWVKYHKDHPELKGVYPGQPSVTYGYEWPVKGKLSGTKEDWLKLIKKLGFTFENQWIKYYKVHPELKGVYPGQPSVAYGYKWPTNGKSGPKAA